MKNETEYQTAGGQSTSQKLSMQATTPPAQVPGYRLTQFLGAGAFGQVWVGRDLNTGRDVAVKFYLHRGGVNWSLLSREVKNLVQLSADRYVVQVLEVGWDADPPYYVMELVSGGSLEDALQTKGQFPVGEAVEMFRKICIGLNRCHAKGVLHCDIKPANILLGDDHEPRLADFGQSRLTDDQTPALGTLFYMAPEQADLNSTPDASWDVYAVGAIMFRMLTGKPPHRDDKTVEHLDTAGSIEKRLQRYREAINASPAPAEHAQRDDVDRSLARIVSKCLAADTSVRYANVQQILQDLSRRDAIRSRQPLMLLGIVGPLLVLLATSFFMTNLIKRASESTRLALRYEAFSSNQWAAANAARNLENDIDGYFRLVREEAATAEFTEQLTATLYAPSVKQSLEQIAAMRTPSATESPQNVTREAFLDDPDRLALDALLRKRLERYTRDAPDTKRLASMFVTDHRGTIISIAYDEPVDRTENSAGRNYAYRTYFHGGPRDLSKETTQIGDHPPLNWTHLSSAFQSTATRLWKVAVSTPIYLTDDRDAPDAMFVTTINLGDFQLLQSEGGNQVAAIVYARGGPQRGTIMQHPLMDQRRAARLTKEGEKFQIPEDLMMRLMAGGDVDYLDPLAEAEDAAAANYAGPWIAAIESVAVPAERTEESAPGRDQSAAGDTDLLVLVQYRLEKVFEPVERMKTLLLWEGAAALLSILVVTISLWAFVRRVGGSNGESRRSTEKQSLMPETLSVR